MKQIQMVDLKGQYLAIKDEIDEAIQDVINNATFIKGPPVHAFERELAEYCAVKHVVTCGNGTDALQIAMMALGFKAGDEVIVPAYTYVATVEVIALLGLRPVFVDVDPDTFNLDPEKIEQKISKKTVGIVPVHLYGQCAAMESIMNIADQYGLKVIEDAAQAMGAKYTFSDGTVKDAGTIGHIGATSFFPSKNLGCFGDGGALLINDAALAERCRMIANHGQRKKYYHELVGINSRLDTLQAAILRVKLKKLDEYCTKRQKAAEFYDMKLSGATNLKVPYRSSSSTHVYHQYTLKTDGIDRLAFKSHLADHGIPTMIYYPLPVPDQKAYQHLISSAENFPIAKAVSAAVISLPIHTELEQEVQQFIVDKIESFLN